MSNLKLKHPLQKKKPSKRLPPQRQSDLSGLDQVEATRLRELHNFDNEARALGYSRIAGIDEAGRGPLAGPVVAAVCILPPGRLIPYINDSKQLTPARRCELFEILTQDPTIHYGIGMISSFVIDKINILQATIQAMRVALFNLWPKPDYILVDGLALPIDTPNQKVIRGDARSLLIASASILAKVTRDRLMQKYHQKWPEYGFDQHKGYGTKQHRQAIAKYGPCPIHRLTFAPLKS